VIRRVLPGAFAALALGVLLAWSATGALAAEPAPAPTHGVARSLESSDTSLSPEPTSTPMPTATPTAVFTRVAKVGGLVIHFPASDAQMLDAGFHQAENRKAFKFLPTMKCLRIQKERVTKRALSTNPLLRLFQQPLRGRGSSNFSAVDCATVPNATILAPATGTVTRIRRYKLYGRYQDLQLEIQPDGAPNVRVVVLHIRDMQVALGQRVEGGVTPVATVRHFKFVSTVNRFLPVKRADHAHIQINDRRYKPPGS
jgi:hypothetical protein